MNGKGFATEADARLAANAALDALDGDTRWRLAVEHGSARFEVAGSASRGLVCHRNPLVSRDASWLVLEKEGASADGVVEVPMGGMKASLPLQLVHDLATVSASLDDFFKSPDS